MLGSAHKMNMGGNAVVLDGNSYTQYRDSGRKTRMEHEGDQHVMYLRVPSGRRIKEEGEKEENKTSKGNKFEILAA